MAGRFPVIPVRIFRATARKFTPCRDNGSTEPCKLARSVARHKGRLTETCNPRLTLRAAVGLAGLLRYHGVERRGMRRWLIVAGRSCGRMRVGSRRGRRGRGYRLLGLLGLLHITDGRGCCRGGAVATPGATSHDAAGRLLLLRRLLLLLLLLLRRLLGRRWFLRVRRRLAYRLCNEKRDPILNINSPGCRGVLGAHVALRDTAPASGCKPISKAVNLYGTACAKIERAKKLLDFFIRVHTSRRTCEECYLSTKALNNGILVEIAR